MSAEDHSSTYAVIGELVLISSALNEALNGVLIAFFHLGDSPLLHPVVSTLDPSRKLEMLKARLDHITADEWKKPIKKFVERVEMVNKHRNTACHSAPVLENGKWTLRPTAAAKLLNRLDLDKKMVAPSASIHDLKNAIKTGEQALGDSVNLIENFKRIEEERKRRIAVNASTDSLK